MNALGELYQELILDHNARPRNFGALKQASHKAEGINPLCGDHVVVYIKLNGNVIEQLQFDGKGCAISKASASLMTQSLRGKTVQEAQATFGQFHEMVTQQDDEDEEGLPAQGLAPHDHAQDEARDQALGKLAALAGVRGFPMRIKCATLAWHTLNAALDGKAAQVSTEDTHDTGDTGGAKVPLVQEVLRTDDAPATYDVAPKVADNI